MASRPPFCTMDGISLLGLSPCEGARRSSEANARSQVTEGRTLWGLYTFLVTLMMPQSWLPGSSSSFQASL